MPKKPSDALILGAELEKHRSRLRQLIHFRIDPRLAARVDPSDVVQETFVEAMDRYAEYRERPAVPFFVWLRTLALQRLSKAKRAHLLRQRRDVNREVSLQGRSDDTSLAIVNYLLDQCPSPSSQAQRNERRSLILAALDSIDPIDREVLALRHFEMLDNNETAQSLGISSAAASKRHVRALARLKEVMRSIDERTPSKRG